MISSINNALIINGINDMESHLEAQAKIVSDEVVLDFNRLDISSTRNYMRELIKKYSLDLDSRILIFNEYGVVQLDSYDKLGGHDLSELFVLKSALKGNVASEVYRIKETGDKLMYASVPMYSDDKLAGGVLLSSSANYIFDKAYADISRILFLSVLGIIILGTMGFVFADFFAAPVEDMIDSLQAISHGEYNKRVLVTGNDEFANLANAYNIMLTQLEQVDTRRKQFVSNVSHELRTPMASMKIISETLLSKPHWEEDVYREFFEDVALEITRLNEIIDSFLYLVDIEKKELELKYSLNSLNKVVGGIIKKLRPLADKKNIKIYFDNQKDVKIQIDKGKIQQCIINILGNAIKYSPDNGEIFISIVEEKNNSIVHIRDTGFGIPEEDLPYIFDRFHRVDKARSRATGGLGLGLAIAQQIVHLHQGNIVVDSKVGIGTTMSIILPSNIKI